MEDQRHTAARHFLGVALAHAVVIEIPLVTRLRPGHPLGTRRNQPLGGFHLLGIFPGKTRCRLGNLQGDGIIGLHQADAPGFPLLHALIPALQGDQTITQPDQQQDPGHPVGDHGLPPAAHRALAQQPVQQHGKQRHHRIQPGSTGQLDSLQRRQEVDLPVGKVGLEQHRIQRHDRHQAQRKGQQLPAPQAIHQPAIEHAAQPQGQPEIAPEQRRQQGAEQRADLLEIDHEGGQPVTAPGKTQHTGKPAEKQGGTRAGIAQCPQQRQPGHPADPVQIVVQPWHAEHQTCQSGQQQAHCQAAPGQAAVVGRQVCGKGAGVGRRHGCESGNGFRLTLSVRRAGCNTLSE